MAEAKRVHTEDGQDITEPVQILYDIAHSSMDWGSSFLDNEEMEAVIRLAITMGWEVPTLPDNSPAIESVARLFPDHYEVSAETLPATKLYPNGLERIRIRTKKGGA